MAAAVFVVGHVFNVVINLLGAFVHPARLQFVEFFSKFYEGGGRPFAPFASVQTSLVLGRRRSRPGRRSGIVNGTFLGYVREPTGRCSAAASRPSSAASAPPSASPIAARTVSGIVAEDGKKFGKLLPIAAMPGTQGIYGFIAAVLVLIFFNILGGNVDLPRPPASRCSSRASRSAWLCFVSAHLPGPDRRGGGGHRRRATSEDSGKALIFPALVETYAVLSLIVTILMLTRPVRPRT